MYPTEATFVLSKGIVFPNKSREYTMLRAFFFTNQIILLSMHDMIGKYETIPQFYGAVDLFIAQSTF